MNERKPRIFWHRCGIEGCGTRASALEYFCHQHRPMLGWALNAEVQTAWRERRWDPVKWTIVRKKAHDYMETYLAESK